MISISREQFLQTIQSAACQHNIEYTDSSSLSIRWQDDATSAHQDADHFQSMLQVLQLPAAKELIIESTDETPGWTVQAKFREMLAEAKTTKGRAVVMVHYAGHGRMSEDGTLTLVERPWGGRKLDGTRYLLTLAMPKEYDFRDVDKVDVLFIFDCCYGFTARRPAELSPRIVEVVAATDASAPPAYAHPRSAITAKLTEEIQRRQQEGHRYVEFADMIQILRAKPLAVKKPSHGLEMGAASICLPSAGLATVNPFRIAPGIRAVFSVHIVDKIAAEHLDIFVAWVRRLPAGAAISLEGVYDTTSSTCLVLTSAYVVYSKLAMMDGYHLVTETTGPNGHRNPLAYN